MKLSCSVFLLVLCAKGLEFAPLVHTRNGYIQGQTILFNNKRINTFLGIPFGKPPTGSLRFKAPIPVDSWNGVYNATKQPKACFQPSKPFSMNSSEDCLHLNIWSPAYSTRSSLKAVMVWIYGGAFRGGSISLPIYDGRVLAATGDVAVASINYRVGAFGFLNSYSADAPGNVGILDQNLALRWIYSNIRSFGGDPRQITIFGESAGSMSVHAHLMSPLSKGLFKRAILQSGTQYYPDQTHSLETSLRKSNMFARQLQCSDDDIDIYSHPATVVECLRAKDPQDIAEALEKAFPFEDAPFYPSYGSNILPVNPIFASRRGLIQKADVLIGSNSDEGSIFFMSIVNKSYLQESLDDFTIEVIAKVFSRAVVLRALPQFASQVDFYLKRPEYQGKEGIRKGVSDFLADLRFVCPAVFLSDRYSDKGNRVFMYEYSYRSAEKTKPKWTGVEHGDELPYVFGIPFLSPSRYTEEDKNISLNIMTAWTNFAKTGNPSTSSFSWPLYTRNNEKYADLRSADFAVAKGRRKQFCDFWRSLVES